MATVRTEWERDVAIVRLSRPPVNALTLVTVSELLQTFDELATDPPTGLVLTGDGSAFCAGLDVNEIGAYSAAQRGELIACINEMITRLYGFPAATVAAVGGHAIGAGVVLLLACDARLGIADDAVKIGLTEVTAGVSYPAGPMEVVIAELEPNTRRRLVLAGTTLRPSDAHAVGLLDELVDSDRLLDAAVDLARTRGSAPAYRAVKMQLRGATLARMREIVSTPQDQGGLSS